ncbi:hypothetical protein GGR88_002542 [Sphingomonas jejuensis]|uniref:Porin domain-containing protein n=1 Tax=Sphingomonas jejuensis TaxID=904715 RepID=A0ABX0XNR7_9SPHN|nr:porin [Sphingomonas jejuensis]NJC35028.1 hypothetical protein [Sphingomonas jejuensis]
MKVGRAWLAVAGGALIASALAVVPAVGAPSTVDRRVARPAPTRSIGTFTPAAADPRLAASLLRAGALGGNLRFTPSSAVRGTARAMTVAVRSSSNRPASVAERVAAQSQEAAGVGIAPVAYNLGASVGWRRFSLDGDVRHVDTGPLPGSRERVDVGVSYNAPRWTARIQAQRDEPRGTSRLVSEGGSYSVDVGGSYRLTRNIDLTAGVRYSAERDRLQARADERPDSQAVYLGTAFRF